MTATQETVSVDIRHVDTWVAVCRLEQLQPERGVAALVAGRQVALVRTADGELFAVDNRDPFSGVAVLSRGIVGTRGDDAGRPTLTSPLYKQVFDLRTGRCYDDDSVCLPVHAVRVDDGLVSVSLGPPGV
jgi:nitrite reductase (NADH) small subunit